MRIESSNILMSSARSSSSSHQMEERLRAWESDRRPDFETVETRDVKAALHDLVELSEHARSAVTEVVKSSSGSSPTLQSDSLSAEDKAKILMIEKLFEQVTGKKIKIKILRYKDSTGDMQAQETAKELQRVAQEVQAAGGRNVRAGWGVEYDRAERYEEAERTTFSAMGVVRTVDGKEIEVAVDLNMSREFVAYNETHLRFGDAVRKDPLVINFGGTAADLTTDKFSFDIDLDGNQDQISFVEPGAGFLAIDKNGDGIINDGSELFGPATGDGFSELSAYDTDGSHWIDEGDALFNQLRIWTRGVDGTDQLTALGKIGIGALYLGSVATQFNINDSSNQKLGVIQSTGIWLGENSSSGAVQHIDLIV